MICTGVTLTTASAHVIARDGSCTLTSNVKLLLLFSSPEGNVISRDVSSLGGPVGNIVDNKVGMEERENAAGRGKAWREEGGVGREESRRKGNREGVLEGVGGSYKERKVEGKREESGRRKVGGRKEGRRYREGVLEGAKEGRDESKFS